MDCNECNDYIAVGHHRAYGAVPRLPPVGSAFPAIELQGPEPCPQFKFTLAILLARSDRIAGLFLGLRSDAKWTNGATHREFILPKIFQHI